MVIKPKQHEFCKDTLVRTTRWYKVVVTGINSMVRAGADDKGVDFSSRESDGFNMAVVNMYILI